MANTSPILKAAAGTTLLKNSKERAPEETSELVVYIVDNQLRLAGSKTTKQALVESAWLWLGSYAEESEGES